MFKLKKTSYPAGDSLPTDVFHRHFADSTEYKDQLHREVVTETGQLIGDFGIAKAVARQL